MHGRFWRVRPLLVRGSLTAAAAWLTMGSIFLPVVRFYGLSAGYALLLPFTALFYMTATVEAAVRYWTGNGGGWKGRQQAHDAKGRTDPVHRSGAAERNR